MRKFADIQGEIGLQKFLDSPLGTLYFVPAAPGAPRVMVRHFDTDIPTTLVKPFADLVQAAQQWIGYHSELVRLVKVEQPIEVGRDFVARPHHTYYTSIRAYVEWEDPPEPPDELEQMRSSLRAVLGKSVEPRDIIIETVLARSLLEPTGKTFFDESEGQFIVVEPKLTREDVARWAALSTPASLPNPRPHPDTHTMPPQTNTAP
ncbi:hypothetical protein IC235_05465 [Hymenobacter sp. BT664]|uniref:Uncharacterized protein n=1 Tax=Hymenobacter montanus TaxID=2771359 RepID=A0A927GIQ7_9BACT|nr:hypothetical protein [Hymenobacter montanus]MBD2767336.1 hypothetical protein [Hymenobacter montanus]